MPKNYDRFCEGAHKVLVELLPKLSDYLAEAQEEKLSIKAQECLFDALGEAYTLGFEYGSAQKMGDKNSKKKKRKEKIYDTEIRIKMPLPSKRKMGPKEFTEIYEAACLWSGTVYDPESFMNGAALSFSMAENDDFMTYFLESEKEEEDD